MPYDNVFAGKSVVITGGTGSFGHFMVRELLRFDVSSVTVLSRDEEKQWEMSREFPDKRLRFVIGDVRDRRRMFEVINGDYVYHAAALKIIPNCEANPSEAYKTNLTGSINVRDACLANHVKKAIFISTDKAVKPVNIYGMSKALAERLWTDPSRHASAHIHNRFTIVRYGNVLGSRGSIVPYFKDLMKTRQQLPITHPLMTRFLNTWSEAIDLLFYATASDIEGQVYVPKNPACRIIDLVTALAGPDYPTIVTGIRPGEKIDEILISEEETRRTEENEDYFIVHQYGIYASNMTREYSSSNAKRLNVDEISLLLKNAGL
jgi:UDP-N-acetylglucosamine 4,6-dehydratase/5-epimerase